MSSPRLFATLESIIHVEIECQKWGIEEHGNEVISRIRLRNIQ